eukprot:599271-Amorphochlora_amoeboformis.AAC.2
MNSSGTPTLSLGGTREASSSDLQKSLALVTALSPLASQKPSQNMDALLVSSGGTDPRVTFRLEGNKAYQRFSRILRGCLGEDRER